MYSPVVSVTISAVCSQLWYSSHEFLTSVMYFSVPKYLSGIFYRYLFSVEILHINFIESSNHSYSKIQVKSFWILNHQCYCLFFSWFRPFFLVLAFLVIFLNARQRVWKLYEWCEVLIDALFLLGFLLRVWSIFQGCSLLVGPELQFLCPVFWDCWKLFWS